MSSLEPFVKAYHETIASDRMSSSRVDRIRTEAMQQFHQSSGLVAAIVREHRQARGKTSLSSLYLFDAICRYARDVIRKQASGFDYKSVEAPRGSGIERGTKKALIEGAKDFAESSVKAVDDIITATVDEIREDQKDKVAKVIEIWRKAGTFDEATVHRLHQLVRSAKDERQDDNYSGRGDDDDQARGTAAPSAQAIQEAAASKAATMPNVPSSILAMLGGKDRSNSNGQGTIDDKPVEVKSLDPAQLDALKRFASLQNPGKDTTPEGTDNSMYRDTTAPPGPAPGGPPVHPDRLRQMNGDTPPSAPHTVQQQHYATAAPRHSAATREASNTDTKPQHASVSGFVPDQSVGDLSQFDFSTFDPASPASWTLFAQQWHNTYQYIPTNQELFNGMISGMQAQMYMQAQQMMGSGYGGDAAGHEGGPMPGGNAYPPQQNW